MQQRQQENRRVGRVGSTSSRQLSIRKKLLFGGITTIAFFALIEAVLFLIGVQPQSDAHDPYIGFASHIPLFVESPSATGVLETAPSKLAWFNQQTFSKTKPKNTFRVFCLGGSTTYGRPYEDMTSFAGWLREFLPAADATRKWEVINAGGISYASYRVALVAEELVQYQPDLLVVYTGHNEFLEDRTYATVKQQSLMIRALHRLLRHSRVSASMEQVLRPTAGSTPQSATDLLPAEVATKLDQGVGPDAFARDDRLREQITQHFQFNLNRIVDIADTAGCRLLFVTPAANWADCSPFKSELQTNLNDTQRSQFFELLDRASTCFDQGTFDECLQEVDAALQIEDRYAAAHYLRGRCLAAQDQYSKAAESFSRALEEDVCPLRAPRQIQQIVLQTAQTRHVPVVDFAQAVAEWSPHTIPGDDWFLDHVHPTVDGHRKLSLLILDEMIKRGWVTPDANWNATSMAAVQRNVEGRIDREANGRALRNLAKVFAWAGKQEEADRMAIQASQLIADDKNTQYLAASALLKQGQTDEAVAKLREFLADVPDHPMAVLTLGAAFQAQGRLQDAERQYQRAIQLQPDNAVAHNNLGALYNRKRRWDLAQQYLAKAISLNPRYAKAHYNLGSCYFKQNQVDLSMKSFRTAVQIDPELASAHHELADAYRTQKNISQAIYHYRQAVRVDADRLLAANSLGWLLATTQDAQLRDGTEALRWALHCAEATNYQNPGVFNTLAAAYAETGDFQNALRWQSKALEAAPAAMRPVCQQRVELYRSEKPLRE